MNKDSQEMTNQPNQQELLSKIKPLLNNHRQWTHFSNYIDFLVDQQHKILEQSTDITAIHRAQGSIEALGKIKSLREQLNRSK